jgi:hypothetical protein
MTIGAIRGAPYVPPSQAAVERLADAATTPVFRRPEVARGPRLDPRLQPRQIALSLHKSVAIKRLLEDASGGQSNIVEQLASLEEHLRTGGRLVALLRPGDILHSSSLFILASELATHAKTTDAAFAKHVEAEIAALLSSKGDEINAAINSAVAFSRSMSASVDRKWLRAGYLAVVSSQGTMAELLESLLLRFGPSEFQKGALILLQGLNDDLTSASPSIRPGKLHVLLLSSLVTLRHLTAFMRATVAFIRRNKDGSGHGSDNDSNRNGADTDESAQEEASTVKAFLQLIAGQGSIKLIQSYLEDRFGRDLDRGRKEKVFKDFIAFIQSQPLALWRDRSHKDRLLEALRKQLLVDQLDRPLNR